ncbi:hypothetical protein G6F35_016113 [Rhizopus arrhizus]|nr:hypothetical protein G6F35_016113 [Rhizopus arrhizus]
MVRADDQQPPARAVNAAEAPAVEIGPPFTDQAQGAAARQAEARGLVPRDAVGQAGRGIVKVASAGACNQIVFDAAARHRADHPAVVAHGQHGARLPGRRTPGLHHGHQVHALARSDPIPGLLQYVQIQSVHWLLTQERPGRRRGVGTAYVFTVLMIIGRVSSVYPYPGRLISGTALAPGFP